MTLNNIHTPIFLLKNKRIKEKLPKEKLKQTKYKRFKKLKSIPL